MSRSGKIHVRPDAMPDECRALADALTRWYRREFGRLRLAWIDQIAFGERAAAHCFECGEAPGP